MPSYFRELCLACLAAMFQQNLDKNQILQVRSAGLLLGGAPRCIVILF